MGILKTLLKALGYSFGFALLTAFFTLLTFPEDRLREYLEITSGHAVGGRMSIAELSLSGLGTVEIVDAVLKMPPESDAPDAKPGGMLQVQRLEASASLLGLFDEVVDATFEATVQGGTISGGHILQSIAGFEIEIEEVADVRFGTAGLILKALLGADLRGTMGGRDLRVAFGADWSSLEADLDIDLTTARLVDPTIPTKQLGPLSLSTMSLGQVQLTVKAGKASAMGIKKKKRGPGRKTDETVIRLANVGASGGDVEFQFDDQSLISIPDKASMMQWGLDIHAAVRVKDKYIDHTIEKGGDLEQPNKLLRMYFQQDPRMRAAMRDGVFGLTCRGTFAKPNCRPTPTTIRGFKKRQPRFTGDEEDEDKPPEQVKAKPDKPAKDAKAKRGAKSPRSDAAKSRTTKRGQPPAGAKARTASPDRPRPRPTSSRDRDPVRNGRPIPAAAAARAIPTIVPPAPRGVDKAYATSDEESGDEDEGDDDEDDEDEDEDDDDEDDDDDDEDDDDEDDDEDEDEDDDDEEEE